MSMIYKNFNNMEQRKKVFTVLIVVMVTMGVLFVAQTDLAAIINGTLYMNSEYGSSETAVSAELSATLDGEPVGISYAQSMFAQSLFAQSQWKTYGDLELNGPDNVVEYTHGTTGHKLSVYASSPTLTGLTLWDESQSELYNFANSKWNLEDEYGYPTGVYAMWGQVSIDGLDVGTYYWEVSTEDADGYIYYTFEVRVISGEPETTGIAIDSLTIMLNWQTTMYRCKEETFGLTYSIYAEASPTGDEQAGDYVLEKSVSEFTTNPTGAVEFTFFCGSDICKLENMYNERWYLRIRITLQGTVVDDLGQSLVSDYELPAATILVIWDAEFSVTGTWA